MARLYPARLTSEQLVEEHVRRHEASAPPLSDLGMRPREQPTTALANIDVRFFLHIELAARGAFAAMLAGLLHVLYPSKLVVLIMAVAILCEGANLGQSLMLCWNSMLGVLIAAPLAWVCVAAGLLGPEEVRQSATLAVFGVLAASVGYLKLHPVARKVCLGSFSLGVLLQICPTQGPGGDCVAAPWAACVPLQLSLVAAIARGAACALVAALVPRPRSAAAQADASLRSVAAGVVLLFDGVVGQLHALDTEQRWRTHTERVLTATTTELRALPALLDAARWQPQWRYRKRCQWRAAQHGALVQMAETRGDGSSGKRTLTADPRTCTSDGPNTHVSVQTAPACIDHSTRWPEHACVRALTPRYTRMRPNSAPLGDPRRHPQAHRQ